MLIGLNGKIGSGKDTIADIIIRQYPYVEKKSFAYKLKLISSILIGCDLKDLMMQEGKNLYSEIFRMTYGEVLQNVGTRALRNNFHKEVWIKSLFVDFINEESNWIVTDVRFENEAEFIIKMGGMLVKIVGDPANIRKNSKRDLNHPSETSLDNWKNWNYVVYNNGTLEDLEREAMKVFKMVDKKRIRHI